MTQKHKDTVGMSHQELNRFTAHSAHQRDRDAAREARAEGETAKHEMNGSPAEDYAELGEADGY